MSLKAQVSVVKVRIDNEDYSIVAGSFSYDDGFAERTVENTDNNEVVFGEDQSTAVGMMKFELKSTPENLNSVRKHQRSSSVSIKAFNNDGTWSRTMASGVCINDAEKGTGADGSLELTFKGTPLV